MYKYKTFKVLFQQQMDGIVNGLFKGIYGEYEIVSIVKRNNISYVKIKYEKELL